MQLENTNEQADRKGVSKRNRTLDGLRGVAAMLVVVHHLYLNAENSFVHHVPAWLDFVMRQLGGTGVNIFFVLSGFAIASSLRGAALSTGYLGRFVLRRSIRLDPPYWAAIALAILLTKVSVQLFPDLGPRQDFSFRQLVAHLFYLQDILHYENISAVFWTLCIELQFYLVLALILFLCTGGSADQEAVRRRALLALLGLFIASVVVSVGGIHLPIDGLFVRYWHMFAFGVVTCWVLNGDIRWGYWWALLVIETGVVFAAHPDLAKLGAIFGAAVLVMSGRFIRFHGWFTARPFQYAGRISYSLYLIHPLVGWSAISVSKRLLGEGTLAIGLVHLAIGLSASLVSAALLYALVEKPALNLSRRVSLPQRPMGAVAVAPLGSARA